VAATKSGPNRPFTDKEVTICLQALVAWGGQPGAAVKWLKAEGHRAPTPPTLTAWSRIKHWERYERLRAEYAQRVEESVANDMRDTARIAMDATQLAVMKAKEKLESGRDEDPARTAANLSRVAQTGVEKLLTLTGRPQQITENRDATAILRSLVAKGVLVAPEGEPAGELEE